MALIVFEPVRSFDFHYFFVSNEKAIPLPGSRSHLPILPSTASSSSLPRPVSSSSTIDTPSDGYLTLPFPTPTDNVTFLNAWKTALLNEIKQRKAWLAMVNQSLQEFREANEEA